ncbi:MAG: hypothetical protein JWR80_2322 [Bradyrhizobium sp.]|nr:hypothetical protein [Bradyrhizobium sp.]
MRAARGTRTGVFYSSVFGVAALLAVGAQAAEQCTGAMAEVQHADKIASGKREAHFNLLKIVFADAQAGAKRVEFLTHLKALNDFSATLDGIDKEANPSASPKELKIDKLVTKINSAIDAASDLENARRMKNNSAADSTITEKDQAYVKALDELYVLCLSIVTPIGGEDFYKEAEAYVETQKVKYKAFASRYETLQGSETAAPRASGTGALKGLDTLREFLAKPVGLFVATMAREPRERLSCEAWLAKATDKDTRPTETAQMLICAQLKLEDAKKNLKAINPPCEPAAAAPSPQAGVGIRIDSVVYGQLVPILGSGAGTGIPMGKGITGIVGYDGVYGKYQSCDATNYFREQCEMVAYIEQFCVKAGKLGKGSDCKNGTDVIVQTTMEFLPREQLKQICRVEIDPRKMCGSYVPAEFSPARTATIRYRCSEDPQGAKVWQVYPLKRDKEVAYLYCPDEDRPSEYQEAPTGPIPVQ